MRKEAQVTIDSTNIEDFRKAYQACEGETFIFKGRAVYKRFAMYFLQNWDKNIKPYVGSGERNYSPGELFLGS
jgi:hypothetical protein